MRRFADDRTVAVLERLTAAQRDVLFLRLFARLTVDEAASVLGKRPGAVKALQRRALAAIRREVSDKAVPF
jgi:RNA polymerase sigma-70 factor (ECF subfamily)